MTSPAASYHGYRFPPEIISHAVWLNHRFCLSFRDTEGLLAQRRITVSYEAIRQSAQKTSHRPCGTLCILPIPVPLRRPRRISLRSL